MDRSHRGVHPSQIVVMIVAVVPEMEQHDGLEHEPLTLRIDPGKHESSDLKGLKAQKK